MFRAAIDECASVLDGLLDRPLARLLDPAPADAAILEQTGYWGVYGATPTGTTETASSSSGNTVLWIVIGAVVVVVLVGGGIMLGRRGKTAEDRE